MKIASKSKFIVSPWYDGVFFISSPLWTCALGWLFLKFFERGYPEEIHVWGHSASLTALLALTQAHLVVVFFRSHGNPTIFKQFPWRFTLVPILLFTAIYCTTWGWAVAAFVVVFWDIYHTSQQNFGLARIYDARSGQALPSSRWFEKFVHLMFYACPIFAGSYLMAHVMGFRSFNEVGLPLLGKDIPKWFETNALPVRNIAIAIALATVVLLILVERRRYREGYRYPLPKLLIIFSTLFCSIFAWGFNKFGDAYFIVNMYHAVQYFAIVWATEQKQTGAVVARLVQSYGKVFAFLCFVLPPIIIGSWFEFSNSRLAVSLLLSCAILHFWYDGFIWSVRKKAV